jgi:pteridine reductase
MARRSAIVTGAAKRIGRSLAIGLAERGFDIALHYQHSKQDALETKAAIEKLGRDCIMLPCDLLDKVKTSQLVSQAVEKLSNIELLVNNASIFEKADFLKTDLSLLERNLLIHLQAPFSLTSEFAKICKHGNVINIIDSAIVKTDTEYFAYILSKRALLDLTKLTAKSLAPNIRVNAIAPGSTMQPIDSQNNDYMQKRAKQVPLQMPGSPEYLMQGIDFLLTNPFVTGECLFIDGGAHIEY